MVEARPDSPLADVGSFILFAMRWRDLAWRTFGRYPPDSMQRWRIHRIVCPRYTDDVAETRLVRALAAAERVGKGEAWRQLLCDLDSGLKDYARRFVDSAELPCEPSILNTALNELLPTVDAVRQARAADRLEGDRDKPTTPATVPPKPVKRPSDEAIQTYRLRDALALRTQEEVAAEISKQLGRPIGQGQVSRWLGVVERYLVAGNILPVLSQIRAKPQSIDPEVIEMGQRQDRRTPRQRQRHVSPD